MRAAPVRQLIVFARAPQYGAVKTRLAAEIGTGAAWRAYQDMSRGIVRALSGSPLWETRLAITPSAFVEHGRFWLRHVARTTQSRGNLGLRMAGALRESVARGPVIIVGSDIPAMTQRHIRAAFDLLSRSDLVFGPAADGGYWLVGARRGLPAAILAHLFDEVRWSTDTALKDTLRNVPDNLRLTYAATLRDVDEGADLAAWRARAQGTLGR